MVPVYTLALSHKLNLEVIIRHKEALHLKNVHKK